uniref:Variant surface glycoprotein 1125.1215 n=1 Tax=Trypanosoma brucei TaxID=5691 RepID=A0A1J0R6G3_9TRYP|nr:variant surface glycoprotein 1125.1215 [Trypanosoma brucei]
MKALTILAFLCLTQSKNVRANIAASENAAEYHALCEIIRLATGGSSATDETIDLNAVHAKIQKINMTISPESWKKMFFLGPEDDKWANSPADAKPAQKGWQKEWKVWLPAAQAAKKGKDDADLKGNPVLELNEQQKLYARPHVRLQAAIAYKILSDAPQLTQQEAELTAAKLTSELRKIAYGVDKADETTVTVAEAFGNAATANSEAHCKSDNSPTKPKTVIAALSCICGKHDSTHEEAVCGRHISHSGTWTTTNNKQGDTDLQGIAKTCGKGTRHVVTAAELPAAANNIRRLIKVVSNDGYLGAKLSGTDCNGSKANAICVKLTNYKTARAAADDAISWLGDLDKLVTTLVSREVKAQLRKAALQQLKQAEEAIAETINAAGNIQQMQTTVSAAQPPATKQPDAAKECAAIQTAADCKNNGNCKWDRVDKKGGTYCKLNETEEEKETQAGGTE